MAQVVHVDFHPGQEHEVEETDFAEDAQRLAVFQDPEAVGSESHARRYQPDDVRDAEAVQQQWRQQSDRQYCQDYADRIGKRQHALKL